MTSNHTYMILESISMLGGYIIFSFRNKILFMETAIFKHVIFVNGGINIYLTHLPPTEHQLFKSEEYSKSLRNEERVEKSKTNFI